MQQLRATAERAFWLPIRKKMRDICTQSMQHWYSVPWFAPQLSFWVCKFTLKPQRPKILIKMPRQKLKIIEIEYNKWIDIMIIEIRGAIYSIILSSHGPFNVQCVRTTEQPLTRAFASVIERQRKTLFSLIKDNEDYLVFFSCFVIF